MKGEKSLPSAYRPSSSLKFQAKGFGENGAEYSFSIILNREGEMEINRPGIIRGEITGLKPLMITYQGA
jgi:hypothetical protein